MLQEGDVRCHLSGERAATAIGNPACTGPRVEIAVKGQERGALTGPRHALGRRPSDPWAKNIIMVK